MVLRPIAATVTRLSQADPASAYMYLFQAQQSLSVQYRG